MNERLDPCPRMLALKPPRIALTLVLVAGLLHLATPAIWPDLPASGAGGIFLGLLGSGIMLRAWWLFRIHETAICPTATTTVLITSDVYRLTRNPMYLGILLMLLGTALAAGSLPFYGAALAFFLIIEFVFCPYEESGLATSFGADYADYRRSVRRWL